MLELALLLRYKGLRRIFTLSGTLSNYVRAYVRRTCNFPLIVRYERLPRHSITQISASISEIAIMFAKISRFCAILILRLEDFSPQIYPRTICTNVSPALPCRCDYELHLRIDYRRIHNAKSTEENLFSRGVDHRRRTRSCGAKRYQKGKFSVAKNSICGIIAGRNFRRNRKFVIFFRLFSFFSKFNFVLFYRFHLKSEK